MELCVLGLLLTREMTLYDLRQAFARYLSLFYSDSPGSLQVAVRKLAQAGMLQKRREYTGKRARDVLSITLAGRAAFVARMRDPLPAHRLEAAILTRLYFLGLLSPEDRQLISREVEETIAMALAQLEAMAAQLAQVEIPETDRDVAFYQLATLDYGLMSHRAALTWWRNRITPSLAADLIQV